MTASARRTDRFRDQVVVVTGAASGIGRATALAFAARGARLFVCDVKRAALPSLEAELLARGACFAQAQAVDVASSQQMAEFCQEVCRDGIPEVLVNNAGVGLFGGALATSLEDWQWLVNVNVWGVVHGCHFFGPHMAERGRGHIVNIASAAGFYNSEAMTAYGTTKAAIIGLSDGLRAELADRGVGVSVVCPGFVDTSIIASMRVRGARDPDAQRASVQRFFSKRNFAPERVARAVLAAIEQDTALLPVTAEAWALYGMTRIAPDWGRRLLQFARRLTRER